MKLLLPLLSLLLSLTWLAEGLSYVPCWELAVSVTEQPQSLPALAAPSLLPVPGHGYPVQSITWSDMRDSTSRREDESQSWQKHSRAVQCLYQTCGWDLNRLQMTDNATKELLSLWFWDGEWLIQKNMMSHLHVTQLLGLSLLSLLQSLFTHLLFWPLVWVILLGPGSWSALNRLTALLSQEEESKKRHFSTLFVSNGVLRTSQNVLCLWAFSRSKPSRSCFLNLLTLSESKKVLLCFDTLLCLFLPS